MDNIPSEPLDSIVSAATTAFFHAAQFTPSSLGLKGGRLLGAAACRLLGRHRRIARANLNFAFQGEMSVSEIERLVYQNFMMWGMIAFEWARCAYLDRETPQKSPLRVQVKGLEHLEAAKKKSTAVVLLSAHFGNWEFGHWYYASHFNNLNFIVRRIDNLLVEERRVTINRLHGVNILYKEIGLKGAIRNLKKGQDLVIFADQKANPREGVESRFFGRPTTSIPLVASFAKKFQLPIVPMFVVRRGASSIHELTFLPELEYNQSDSLEAITLRQNKVIESMIRRHPDHWLWMHRRWKTEHPEIYQHI